MKKNEVLNGGQINWHGEVTHQGGNPGKSFSDFKEQIILSKI